VFLLERNVRSAGARAPERVVRAPVAR
jgi:hypothetical protein